MLDHILKISGDKIVTLAIGNQPFAIDIQANGQIGYDDRILLQSVGTKNGVSGKKCIFSIEFLFLAREKE